MPPVTQKTLREMHRKQLLDGIAKFKKAYPGYVMRRVGHGRLWQEAHNANYPSVETLKGHTRILTPMPKPAGPVAKLSKSELALVQQHIGAIRPSGVQPKTVTDGMLRTYYHRIPTAGLRVAKDYNVKLRKKNTLRANPKWVAYLVNLREKILKKHEKISVGAQAVSKELDKLEAMTSDLQSDVAKYNATGAAMAAANVPPPAKKSTKSTDPIAAIVDAVNALNAKKLNHAGPAARSTRIKKPPARLGF